MSLKDKNVLITGGSYGIGRATAIAFAKEGANVIFTYHTRAEEANKVANEIQNLGRKVKAIQFDAEQEQAVDRLVAESSVFGNIHILINNAGIIYRDPFLEVSREKVNKIFKINLFTPIFLAQAFAKKMVEQQKQFTTRQEFIDFHIVNVSSISGKLPANRFAYEITKAALNMFTKSAAMELSRYRIRVNAVAPGLVLTGLNEHLVNTNFFQKAIEAVPLGEMVPVEHVAKEIIHIVTTPSKTGTISTIDGGREKNFHGLLDYNEAKSKL